MAAPVFRAAGAKSAGTTGAVTVAAPAGVATGDLEILISVSTAGGSVAITNNGGSAWTVMTGSPIDVAGGEELHVWWRVRQAGDGNPQVTPGSDYSDSARLAYQTGTFDTADPFEIETTGTETTSDTSFSWAPGTSTTGADRLVLVISSIGRDSNTASVPVCTNAALTSLASRVNYCTNSGSGGGFGCTEGTKAAAGAVGTFACTYAAASPKAYISFAIKPVGVVDHALAFTDDLALSIITAISPVEKILAFADDLGLGIVTALGPVEKTLSFTDDLGLTVGTNLAAVEKMLAFADELGLDVSTVLMQELLVKFADDLGLTIDTNLIAERLLAFSDDLGLTIETALTRELLLAFSESLGPTITTDLIRELLLAVADDLALGQTTALTRETFLALTLPLGPQISTDISIAGSGGETSMPVGGTRRPLHWRRDRFAEELREIEAEADEEEALIAAALLGSARPRYPTA